MLRANVCLTGSNISNNKYTVFNSSTFTNREAPSVSVR